MGRRAGEVSKVGFLLRNLSRRIWVRVAAFAVLGVLTAALGFAAKTFIPEDLPAKIGADAVEAILQILASSMLAVTTFSLSILTAAYAAAGTTATPRAVHLLVSDSVSQTVLATFIGAFLFSLVSIILLKTEVYGQAGRLVLFGSTLLVVLIVVVSLLRWIAELGQLGRVGDTTARVGRAACESLERRLESPWMGGNPLRGDPPGDSVPVHPDQIGYMQHCDMGKLSELAEDAGLLIYLAATPGDFLSPAFPAMHVRPWPAAPDRQDDLRKRLLDVLTIRGERDFEQDPRFGLQVLSEIAQRALSPAVNDPGTAVLVVTHILRVVQQWRDLTLPEVGYPRLFVPSLSASDLIEESLLPIAQNGADNFQVQQALQHSLLALGRISPMVFGASVADLSQKMLVMTRDNLSLPSQDSALRRIAQQIQLQKQDIALM